MATEQTHAMSGGATDPALLAAASPSQIGVELTVPQPTGQISVNHENVLKAAKIIQDALDTEGQQILDNLPLLRVIAPGEDQISVQAAQAWNDHLVGGDDSYTIRVQQYLQSLQNMVSTLVSTARQYGYTEQQITDAFNQTG